MTHLGPEKEKREQKGERLGEISGQRRGWSGAQEMESRVQNLERGRLTGPPLHPICLPRRSFANRGKCRETVAGRSRRPRRITMRSEGPQGRSAARLSKAKGVRASRAAQEVSPGTQPVRPGLHVR